MIESITVPRNDNQRYYNSHYLFFFEMAKAVGVNLQYYDDLRDGGGFGIKIHDKHILIDYSDHVILPPDLSEFDITFKYHYSKKYHSGILGLYPLTPISFYDWDLYRKLREKIIYLCNNDIVLNNQKPGATAKERRLAVQAMLCRTYGRKVDIEITSKRIFWNKINRCLISVCVPGARGDILDRGQWQYMALGACTISPRIDITLPFWKKLESGVHYIECNPDFSNLIDRIEWSKANREECIKVGKNAQRLFLDTSTPKKIWKWINECVEDVSK